MLSQLSAKDIVVIWEGFYSLTTILYMLLELVSLDLRVL